MPCGIVQCVKREIERVCCVLVALEHCADIVFFFVAKRVAASISQAQACCFFFAFLLYCSLECNVHDMTY